MNTDRISYWDYNIDARKNDDNSLAIYTNSDAIKNALMCWARTAKGEILNNPEDGGALDEYVFKNFNESKKTKLLFDFRSELDTYFFPKIKIVELIIDADITLRSWKLKLKYYIPLYDVIKTSYLPLKRIQYKSIFEQPDEEIDYTGTTLENFIKIYLYEQRGIGLKFNGTYWQWGRFVFTELDETDNNFLIIEDMINSNRND
jgi:hypothetical protein